MFAALYSETLGFARLRFSAKRIPAFARRSITFGTIARVLDRRKQTRRNRRRFIQVAAGTLMPTRHVAIARTDVDEGRIILLDPAPRCPLQSDEL